MRRQTGRRGLLGFDSLSSLVAVQMSALMLHCVTVGGSDAGWPVLRKGVGDTAEASLQIFLTRADTQTQAREGEEKEKMQAD